jgi:hypothetical protein
MAETGKKPETETSKEITIKSNEIDPHFKYEISKVPGAEKIKLCFQ